MAIFHSPFALFALGTVLVVGGVLGLRLHPFIALVLGALAVALLTPEPVLVRYADAQVVAGKLSPDEAAELVGASAVRRTVTEFGVACGKIGIVIAMAAIIGKCLLDSGAAHKIVAVLLSLFGVARSAMALVVSGFVLAIPVFFDTVFYLLMPVGRALFDRTRKNYLLYVLCIVAGGTMAHSLVPPTPGPLFVAAELGVDLGTMILGGLVVGAAAVTFGYFFALRANARHTIVPQASPLGRDADATPKDPADLPPALFAFLPIALPVFLIAAATAVASFQTSQTWQSWRATEQAPAFFATAQAAAGAISFLGDKNIALIIAAGVALWLLARSHRGTDKRSHLREATGDALSAGAVIILITAAGGAFGGVLRHTGIAAEIQNLAGTAQLGILPLLFLVTALVRTAQGSATVAMITAAPVATAFLDAGGLGFHPVYLALAIGCGSKPIPWMNDSGFWVITRMSGFRESDTLRFVTPMMSLMGVAGLVATMLGAWLLPLA